ncbi:MAG TPA: hypothetical protein VMW74_10905 [Nitrosopumilaceae archaeon]|jgi:hypothetical protein|nr:hypothetical protein [Nitrosopumilaceae archaeon]
MSDIRFIIVGVILVFTGFLILGTFGQSYQTSNIETSEFENCFEYSDDKEPIIIDCSAKRFERNIFFGLVLSLIVGGVLALLKGVKGDWDGKVKPEDMVGPSKDNRGNENNS